MVNWRVYSKDDRLFIRHKKRSNLKAQKDKLEKEKKMNLMFIGNVMVGIFLYKLLVHTSYYILEIIILKLYKFLDYDGKLEIETKVKEINNRAGRAIIKLEKD